MAMLGDNDIGHVSGVGLLRMLGVPFFFCRKVRLFAENENDDIGVLFDTAGLA